MTDRLVCHFLLDPRPGGPHVYTSSLVEGMPGFRSLVITGGKGEGDHALLNLRHFWAPLYALEVPLNILVIIYWKLTGRLAGGQTLFAVHGAANIAPVIAARLLSIPLAWHIHETAREFRAVFAIGNLLRPGKSEIAVVAHKCIGAFGVEGATYLPSAVDTSFWSPDQANTSGVQWNEGCTRLLMIGNLNPLKGADLLIAALERIDAPVHLRILGAELQTHQDFANSVKGLAAKSSHIVDFAGFADRNTVRSQLATCDVFVLPSRSEACPTVVLEAMAMGVTCAVADVGDVALMIEDYQGAFLFEPGDSESCAESIDSAISYGGEHGRLSDTWQLQTLVSRAEAIYSKLLG